MSSDYLQHIQFEGATWRAIKHHLEEVRANKVRLLVSSETHDESNRIRGAIQVLDQLIAMDKPTAMSANRGT
jgi:ABC-type molybdate transport system ATPase subunit